MSGNPDDLMFIGFLGFFSFYFVGKIQGTSPDERFYEDVQIAKGFMGKVAIWEFAILMVLGIFFEGLRPYYFIIVSGCFASILIAYAIKLYLLEEK